MRINAIILLSICLILALLTYALDFQDSPRSAKMKNVIMTQQAIAPDFTFQTIDGEEKTLSSIQDKVILLNFWATWCAPCIIEFPQMVELALENENLALLAVSVDKNPDALQTFLSKQIGLKHEDIFIVHDIEQAIAHDIFQSYKYPETFIISPDLKIKDKIIGAVDWSAPEVKERILSP